MVTLALPLEANGKRAKKIIMLKCFLFPKVIKEQSIRSTFSFFNLKDLGLSQLG